MAAGISRNKYREMLILKTVAEFLHTFKNEAYHGRVTTQEVVEESRDALKEYGFKTTKVTDGIAYDAIREYGPVGENDLQWAKLHNVDTTAAYASIDEWSMLA